MQTIATNIRLPKQDYEELRTLAFQQKTSIASLVSSAIKDYKFKKMSISMKSRLKLFESMNKSRLKSEVPTIELIKEGRKYE